MFRTHVLVVGALIMLALASRAAADRYWVTNGSSDFDLAANWSTTSGGAGGASKPDITQPTFFDLAGASPYTVNFTGNEASNAVTVTNNALTLDVNTFTYTVGDSATGGHDVIVSATGSGTASLTLADGTLGMGGLPPFTTGTQVLNFARVQGNSGSGGATLSIDGPTAVFWAGQTVIGVPGSPPANSLLEVTNGGTYHGISDAGTASGSIAVSGASSLMTVYSFSVGGNHPGTLNITDGTLRVQSAAGIGAGNMTVGAFGVATLDDGRIELNGSSGGTYGHHGILRGNGIIARVAGATGLATVRQDSYETNNFSRIRPGDLSATPAVGTITLEHANLGAATFGPAGVQQQVFFDLASPTSYDRILLSDPGVDDGTVTATLIGSILFNNLSAINFESPTAIDLIQAEQIIDGGFTTPDLATAAAAWTYNSGDPYWYSLGIVTVDTNDVRLRLFVVPEPASIASSGCVGLALLLVRRRRMRE